MKLIDLKPLDPEAFESLPSMVEDTIGAGLAREAREQCNNLTESEREALMKKGMELFYGKSHLAQVPSRLS